MCFLNTVVKINFISLSDGSFTECRPIDVYFCVPFVCFRFKTVVDSYRNVVVGF